MTSKVSFSASKRRHLNPKIPLIIDTDPGIDDAYAIIYAYLSQAFDIQAIFSVAGNVPIEMTSNNAGFLISTLKVDTPVYEGAHGPLVGEPVIAKYAHGSNGLGGFPIPENHREHVIKSNPTDAYARLLLEAKEPLTIAAIGPLTNLAKLLVAYPGIQSKIKALYVMGGGIQRGNITPRAEFNIYADPLAAKIVFNAGLNPYVVPLDTTEAQIYNRAFMDSLKNSSNPLARLLYAISDAKMNYAGQTEDHPIFYHDMVTLVAISHPEYFTMIPTNIDVETHSELTKGETIFDLRQTPRRMENNAVYVSGAHSADLIRHCQEVLTHGQL